MGDEFAPYLPALERVMNMQTKKGRFPFHEENSNGGSWLEGTAFTTLALREFGYLKEAERAENFLEKNQLKTGEFLAATKKD